MKGIAPQAAEWLALVTMLAPKRLAVGESSLEAEFLIQRERSGTESYNVSLINLGFHRKFKHSGLVSQKLTMQLVAHTLHEEKLRG